MDIFALAALKKANTAISEIEGIGNVITFKGVVDSSSNLPLSNNKKGDLYIVSGDGSEWIWVSDSSSGTISDYEQLGTVAKLPAELGFGYTTCSTGEFFPAKTASLSNYVLTTGGIVSVKFTNAVPSGSTLNISSTGAKAIYYKGAAITNGVIKAGDTATFIYSTYYHLISIDSSSVMSVDGRTGDVQLNDTYLGLNNIAGFENLLGQVDAVTIPIVVWGDATVRIPNNIGIDPVAISNLIVSSQKSVFGTVVLVMDGEDVATVPDGRVFELDSFDLSTYQIDLHCIKSGILYQITMNYDGTQYQGTMTQSSFAPSIKYTTLTLAVNDWLAFPNGYTCQKTVTGMTTTSIVWLTFSDTEIDISTDQRANALNFAVATLPSAAITVNVSFVEGEALT